MTNPSQNAPTNSSEGDAELKKVDDQASQEYLPMNVFIDPRAMGSHHQGFSVSAS